MILLILAGLAFCFLTGASAVSYVVFEVYAGNYDHLKREKILEILSKESIVYYADGSSQLGSLFGNEHRQYVPLKEMPRHLLDAIVAAEDDTFYQHFGIDPVGTMRAVYRNIFMGKREGASTITQQTVKNLYGRRVNNVYGKFVEMVNAFKMERRYSKDNILEFYLNQFHVTGNGRGVGIAATYYFNKEPHELTLTESAFIVGSVKAPYRYNPFTKTSLEAQKKAKDAAKVRKNYVLKRMLENKFINQAQFDASKEEIVPFKQGKFQFNELAVTELVQRQLNRPEMLQLLGADTVDSVASMGLRITTTIEKPVQIRATYGVRQNLSRLEMILTGFEKEKEKSFVPIQRPEKYEFYVTRVKEVDKTPKQESLKLSIGIPECVVPTDGVDRVANIMDQSQYKGLPKIKADFLAGLNIGDYVLASVRDILPDGKMVCDIERRPRIQGGLIVLDKGKVVSMVGGFQSFEYNRAVFAKRQPGSTFKTLTYYPALQLGWHILEPLLNVRNVYTWQNVFYFPRPDHRPETVETSFPGAGAKSENLASIWLLAHLTDHLTFDQFKELLQQLNLYSPDVPEGEWFGKLANKFNVKLKEEELRAGLFNAVRTELSNDISVMNNSELRMALRTMNYGIGFEKEIAKSLAKGGKDKWMRVHVLRNNFQRWLRIFESVRLPLDTLRRAAQTGDFRSPEAMRALMKFRMFTDGRKIAYISDDNYQPGAAGHGSNPSIDAFHLEKMATAMTANKEALLDDNVYLDGIVSISSLREIEAEINARYAKIADASVLEKLYWHYDFRYSIGMAYAEQMLKHMGVQSQIQRVPSYPLGANDVTLAELALAYQTVLTGQTYQYFKSEQENQILVIKRIEDQSGNLVWEGEGNAHQLIDKSYSAPMLSVLRGTVTHGTGRAANAKVILRSNDPEIDKQLQAAKIRVPTFGKTGTTNNYVNASFVGYLPYPEADGAEELTAENAYTIAAYVGYDSNEPMTKRGFKVAGGTGALPAWIETAVALITEQKYAEKLSWEKLAGKKVTEIPFDYGRGNAKVTVPLYSGAAAASAVSGDDGSSDVEELDLTKFINDNAQSKSSNVHISLAGKVDDGIFRPQARVSFFEPYKAEVLKAPVETPKAGAPDQPLKEEAASVTQPPAATPTPADGVKTLLDDNESDDVPVEDLHLPPPPAPPGLGGAQAGETPAVVPNEVPKPP